jgi:hypothetical protein
MSNVSPTPFEREKWEAEVRSKERELAIKEAEVATKRQEVEIKEKELIFKERKVTVKETELHRSHFRNPLLYTAVAAVAAALITGQVAIYNETSKSQAQQDIERGKADAALILEMIKTNNDSEKARANLNFLITAGLLSDKARKSELQSFLSGPNQVPTLAAPPSARPAATQSSSWEFVCALPTNQSANEVGSALEKQLIASSEFTEVSRTSSSSTESSVLGQHNVKLPGGFSMRGPRFRFVIRTDPTATLINVDVDFRSMPLSTFIQSSGLHDSLLSGLNSQLEKAVPGAKASCRSA